MMLLNPPYGERIGELDPAKETLVTCQSGLRAHIATRILKQHGFGDVKNLTGGMMMQQRVCPDELTTPGKGA